MERTTTGGTSSGWTRVAAVAAPLAALLLAACVGEPVESAASGERQCFLPRQVSGFHTDERDSVHVEVGASQVYELEIVATCPDIDWSQRIAIRSTGGSSWVCRGMDAEIIVPSPSGTQRCPVTGVRRLTDTEVQAWRESRRSR